MWRKATGSHSLDEQQSGAIERLRLQQFGDNLLLCGTVLNLSIVAEPPLPRDNASCLAHSTAQSSFSFMVVIILFFELHPCDHHHHLSDGFHTSIYRAGARPTGNDNISAPARYDQGSDIVS